jgi:hypothetical protein
MQESSAIRITIITFWISAMYGWVKIEPNQRGRPVIHLSPNGIMRMMVEEESMMNTGYQI